MDTDNKNYKKKSTSRKKKAKKKKKSLAKKIFIGFLTIIIILIGVGYYLINSLNLNNIELNKNNLGVTSDDELSKYSNYNKIVNIALFGVDSTDSTATGRSDATMVATLDPIHNKLKITSFMRDSYVSVDGYGYTKLNHAYAYGGAELAINTINQNFGLNITEFVAVDFSTLPVIIDKLGGIDLEITYEETEYINYYINQLNSLNGTTSANIYSSGVQHLDGTQALAYTRIRYTAGGDFERTQRQRTVLSALFDSAMSLPKSSYVSLINDLSQYVQTSLSSSDIVSLVTKSITMGVSGIELEQQRFPLDDYCEGSTIDGTYYLTFDAYNTKEQVKDYIFDDILPSEEEETTDTYSDTYSDTYNSGY